VLDDYHTVTNPEVHRSVGYLIDNAPRCLHLAISTRSDPPFPLASHRAAGTISEVRVEQLQMSTDEAQRFLEQRFGVHLTLSEAGIVRDRTEGWPAGIQLAGLSLAREPDRAAFLASFAGDDRNIAEYLATEVLRRVSEPLRHFLLNTSVLDEFDADVCDHLLEIDNSAQMLEEIDQSNLFLVGLDARRRWYRYHHLFRDWLRHEHRLTAGVDKIALLHQRAAAWTLDNGFSEQAVGHLVEAGDFDQAARIMSEDAESSPGGELVSVYRWLDRIPDEQIKLHPLLALAKVAPTFASIQ
jgi:LuxR family maltose regulon positive regulatory protein